MLLVLALGACTQIDVKPVDDALQMEHSCIQRNPAVIRADFLPAVEQSFHERGITTEVFNDSPPPHCKFIVTYTARQQWDVAMVLMDAEVWVHQDGVQIAHGKYHVKGGGWDINYAKYGGSEEQFGPVMDQLLQEYPEADISSEP